MRTSVRHVFSSRIDRNLAPAFETRELARATVNIVRVVADRIETLRLATARCNPSSAKIASTFASRGVVVAALRRKSDVRGRCARGGPRPASTTAKRSALGTPRLGIAGSLDDDECSSGGRLDAIGDSARSRARLRSTTSASSTKKTALSFRSNRFHGIVFMIAAVTSVPTSAVVRILVLACLCINGGSLKICSLGGHTVYGRCPTDCGKRRKLGRDEAFRERL